jgi:hypothetical protein
VQTSERFAIELFTPADEPDMPLGIIGTRLLLPFRYGPVPVSCSNPDCPSVDHEGETESHDELLLEISLS